jgi:hypothetical protein
MLHHLVGLLLRALNAQVTGAKPLQVQADRQFGRILKGSPRPCTATALNAAQGLNKRACLRNLQADRCVATC